MTVSWNGCRLSSKVTLFIFRNGSVKQLFSKNRSSVDSVTALLKNASVKKQPESQSLLDALKGGKPTATSSNGVTSSAGGTSSTATPGKSGQVKILTKKSDAKDVSPAPIPEPVFAAAPFKMSTSPTIPEKFRTVSPTPIQFPLSSSTPIERQRSSTEPLPPLAPTNLNSMDGVLLDYLKRSYPNTVLRPDQLRQSLYQLLHNKEFLYDLYLLYSESNQ